MKKILGLTVAALLVMGLVGGGTWAYFSDTETSGTNVLSAGTLDLTMGGATAPFSLSSLKPGDSNDPEVSWSLTQSGNISGNLSISIDSITNSENTVWDPEDDLSDTEATGELGSTVKIVLYLDPEGDGWESGDTYLLSDGSTGTTDLSAAYDYVDNFAETWSNVATLADGDVIYFHVGYNWPDGNPSTDNLAMSDNCTFDITFDLQQS